MYLQYTVTISTSFLSISVYIMSRWAHGCFGTRLLSCIPCSFPSLPFLATLVFLDWISGVIVRVGVGLVVFLRGASVGLVHSHRGFPSDYNFD